MQWYDRFVKKPRIGIKSLQMKIGHFHTHLLHSDAGYTILLDGFSLTTDLIRLSHNWHAFAAAESLPEYQRSPYPIIHKEKECVKQLELDARSTETDAVV